MSDKYPEHEKLKKHSRDAATLSGFIDFISEQGWELAAFDDKTERLHSSAPRRDYRPIPWHRSKEIGS